VARPRLSYAGPTTVPAGTTAPIGVQAGDRLIVYVSAGCTLAWANGPGGAPGAFWTANGPAFAWPITVPELVQQMEVTAGAAPVIVRVAYDS